MARYLRLRPANVQTITLTARGRFWGGVTAPPPPAAPSNSVAPFLSGALFTGETLTANRGVWSGVPAPTYQYEFRRQAGGTVLQAFSSSNTYVVASTEVGQNILVAVRATNSEGTVTVTSAAIGPFVASPNAPVNTALPVISGLPWTGQTLTTTTGTWTGSPSPTFSYQWRRNTVAITGATSSSYLLTVTDIDANIDVVVTAANGVLPNASATAASVGPIIQPDVIQEFQATRGWDFSQITGTLFRTVPEINGGPQLLEADGRTSEINQSTGILTAAGIGASRINRAVLSDGISSGYHWQTLNSTDLDVPAGASIWYRTIYIDAPSSPGGTIGIVEHRSGLNINRLLLNNGADSGSVFYTVFEGSGAPGPGFYSPFPVPIDGVPMLIDTYINGTTGAVTHSVNGQHVSSSSSAFATLPARSIINPFFGTGQGMSGSILFVGYRLGASADAFSTSRHNSDATRLGLL